MQTLNDLQLIIIFIIIHRFNTFSALKCCVRQSEGIKLLPDKHVPKPPKLYMLHVCPLILVWLSPKKCCCWMKPWTPTCFCNGSNLIPIIVLLLLCFLLIINAHRRVSKLIKCRWEYIMYLGLWINFCVIKLCGAFLR